MSLKDLIPNGFFSGPKFRIEEREEHGVGYHTHVRVRVSGRYIRSGHKITYKNGIFYIWAHGKKGPLFDAEKNKSKLLKDIKPSLETVFKKIPNIHLARPPKEAKFLYEPI